MMQRKAQDGCDDSGEGFGWLRWGIRWESSRWADKGKQEQVGKTYERISTETFHKHRPAAGHASNAAAAMASAIASTTGVCMELGCPGTLHVLRRLGHRWRHQLRWSCLCSCRC